MKTCFIIFIILDWLYPSIVLFEPFLHSNFIELEVTVTEFCCCFISGLPDRELHQWYCSIQNQDTLLYDWKGNTLLSQNRGPVVQSVVSLTSLLRVISLTVLADSIYNILIFFAEKMWVAFALQKLLTFFQQKISAYLHITRCKF